MPNEIYHKSNWGNANAGEFGDVYFDAAATNKLYNHSDYYENSNGTDKILRDLSNKASIVLTPTAYSNGSLNTVIPTDGNGDFDFSRGSSATRVNEKGLIESIASGLPRIDYSSGFGSLLLEPQRTNLFTESETFSNWSNSQSTETINSGISPDGSNTATKLKPTTATSAWSGLNSPSLSITSGTDYTFSLFAKKDEYSYVQVGGSTPRFNGSFSTIDLSNGTVVYEGGINADVESYGNDWYRISFTQTAVSSGSGLAGFIAVYNYAPNSRLQAFNGDGSSGILVWGCQIEAGSFPTSYIPTNGSTVTRSADVANNSGNADLFNDSEGVLYAEIAALANDSTNRKIAIGTSSNRIIFGYKNSSNQVRVEVISSGSVVFDNSQTINDVTTFSKFAIKYKQNDFALWMNGQEIAIDTSGNTPIGLSELAFDDGGSNNFYGNTKELAVFKEALTDAELESLTSWVSFTEMATDLNLTIK